MCAQVTTSQVKKSLRISLDTWAVVVALLAARTKSIKAGSQPSSRRNSQNFSRLLETQNAYQFPD
jgi:hypothetical protein